jgi:peptide/nickel transport system substrate-binding protein
MDHAKELRGVGKGVQNFTVAPIGGPFLKRVKLNSSG